MGHRQVSNSFSTFGNAQNQHQSYISGQPFTATGRFADSGGSFVPSGDVQPICADQQLNSRSRGNHQYHYSNSSVGAAQFPPPQISGPPYAPFAQSSTVGTVHGPGSNGYHGGLADHLQSNQRGLFKRKRSSISYDVGSSSGSLGGMLGPIPENENIPSHLSGFPRCRSSGISINGDESWRDLRRRYTYDSRRAPDITHRIPNYTSVEHQFATHPSNYSGIRNTTGSSSGRNLHSGRAADLSAPHNRSCFSTGNFNSSSHRVGGFAVDPRESRTNYTGRVLPPNSNDMGHMQLGYAAATSTENGGHSSTETFSFGNTTPSSAEGWPGWSNHSQHGNFGVTNALPSARDSRDIMRSEQPLRFEHQSFSDGSRNLLDEYIGMRLDVDNMSYEELLALGERIGDVNTGLSEDVVTKCITAEVFVPSHGEDKSCAICLEVYQDREEVGTMMKCGHDYHVSCISKWLSMKKVCPICKSAALMDEV
ncbi:unnamed protein product [Cuscuta epithymum]|uniref:RING-type E3 ubiquitin transferase n=1 Tax=Cuscuta epithymum TaxID=186058 RepID=A0AAV0FQL4_9ASTE|nr:unnamed protein product [Cuscuta epithymum]